MNDGQSAEFTVAASGPDLTYQWQQRKQEGDFYDIQGASSTTYRIDKVNTREHEGQYRCKISGEVLSEVATLSVGKWICSLNPICLTLRCANRCVLILHGWLQQSVIKKFLDLHIETLYLNSFQSLMYITANMCCVYSVQKQTYRYRYIGRKKEMC